MRRSIRIASMSALLVVLSLTFSTRAVATDFPNLCQGMSCIQVGTFNVEWFGTTDTSKHAHRSALAIQQVADLIATTLDLEIVVLEEINSQSAEFERLKTALGAHGYKLRSGTSGGEQHVVIAYDDDEVDLIGEARELDVRSSFSLGSGCSSSSLRRPLMANFRAGQFDFIFVGVHLKAQPGGPCSDNVRMEQSKDLIAEVNEMVNSSNEKDVIIAGDFNATSSDTSLVI